MIRVMLSVVFLALFFNQAVFAGEFSGTLEQIQQSGKMRIGYRTSMPPMSSLGKDNTPEGYSIDLCKQIAAGVKNVIGGELSIEYIPVTAENRFAALVENKIDILCGATTDTLARREIVDFTLPTFVTGGSYLTLKGTRLQNNFEGKKIGVVKGTTTLTALEKLFQEVGVAVELIRLDTTAEGFTALKEGEIDAFSADQVVLIGLVLSAEDPDMFSLLPDLFSFEPFALAVRRNDADFRLAADRVLAGLYRSRQIDTVYDNSLGSFATARTTAFEAMIDLHAIPEE